MYLLEGNIGVGKSTFLQLLQKFCPDIAVVEEPKDNWASFEYGQSLLGNFYQDPKRWAYTLETLAMISRVREQVREQQQVNKNRVMERSVYSGYYCFGRNGYEHGFLTELEWGIHAQWFEFLVERHCLPPIGFIYLRAEPSVCFDRMRMRNRKGEEGISMEYMQQIHSLHEKFLMNKEGISLSLRNTPVLVLDTAIDFVINEHAMQDHASKVRAFMQQTQRVIKPAIASQPRA